jgi:hypothetical protein
LGFQHHEALALPDSGQEELKSGLGLGHHQVSGDEERSMNSLGTVVLAYLFFLRACHHEITSRQSWSIFQPQHAFQLQGLTKQVEYNVKAKMKAVKQPNFLGSRYEVSILSL